MSKRGKDHRDELMSNGHDRFFVGESFLTFLEEVFPKCLVMSCHLCCHKPNYSPKSISSLRYPALSNVVAVLMDSRIKPCISDELFVVVKAPYVSNFSQEVDGSYVSIALIGDEERIDDHRMVTFFGKKDKEVNMITGERLASDEDGVFLELQKAPREFLKPSCFHRCGDFKELLSSLIDSACRERVFKRLDTNKYLIRSRTSHKALGQGQDLPPYQSSILTRATYAQPTYHGLGRQGTDSNKGFITQVNEVLLPQPKIYYIQRG